LACVGQLAQAVGPDYTEHARSLLEPMFQGGLSPILVESLAQTAARYAPGALVLGDSWGGGSSVVFAF
jgi:hypothetical protein